MEPYLKKQSQFIRIAKKKKAKMSVNLEFIRVHPMR